MYQKDLKWNKVQITKHNYNYFKNKYYIVFYDSSDELFIDSFNTLRDICKYKKLEVNYENIKNLNRKLINALKNDDHSTRMLDGTLMHVYLIDVEEDDREEDEESQKDC